MTSFIALLRAVNVGGTGKLPMSDLKRLCEDCGFAQVRTYIASGNVLFESDGDERQIKAVLEAALATHMGKPCAVMVRTPNELAAVLAANPFQDCPGNRVMAVFLDDELPDGWEGAVKGRKDEQMAAGPRTLFIHYPQGQADTRLVVPAASAGTARNINTVTKLLELTGTV